MTSNQQATDAHAYTYLQAYQKPAFNIASVKLQFDLSAQDTKVEAWVEFTNVTAPLLLHGEDVRLEYLAVNGNKVSDYQQTDKAITLDVTGDFTLHQIVHIVPEKNTRLEGLYSSGKHLMTQCEAEGFRRIMYYPDRPDVLSSFHVSLTADKQDYPTLLAGGNFVSAQDLPDGKHQAVFFDPHPKPSYLFALVAGDFDRLDDNFTTKQGQQVGLTIHVDKGNLARSEFAMQALKNAMKWDEDIYNFCYDLEHYHIVAANDFNMGAMENKGLNIFNAKLVLASPDTATDTDYDLIDAVIAHEYFHNWTGNRITCRDWFQLSLKEGLTVFREQQYCADQLSFLEQRVSDVGTLRSRQFPEDAGPTAHPVRPEKYLEINNFYTTTIYEKGSELIRMFHQILGTEKYYQAIDIYRQKHDGTAATCEDFFNAMQQASGQDLSQFMRWYEQAGTPEVTVKITQDGADKVLTLSQQIPQLKAGSPKQPHMIPLKFAWLDPQKSTGEVNISAESDDADISNDMILLRQQTQRFTFKNMPANALLSLNRGFSAPVKITGDFDYFTLARCDNDPFSRWDAKEQFLLQEYCAMLSGQKTFADAQQKIYDLFADLLADKEHESFLWQLPDISSCALAMSDFSPHDFYALSHQMEQFIASNFQTQLTDIYHYYTPQGDSDYRRGRRARQSSHMALYYLSLADNGAELLSQHYENARNMTEKFAALRMIRRDVPQFIAMRSAMLQKFADDWQDEKLVMNKWLAVQGGILAPEQLTNIQAIIAEGKHFSLKNPNNIYALVGQMTATMSPAYHRADGAGYKFLGEFLQQLDKLNPQVSARLLGIALMNSDRLKQNYQQGLIGMLQKLLALDLSPDMFEIAENHLQSLSNK